jgi:hypothetical protein
LDKVYKITEQNSFLVTESCLSGIEIPRAQFNLNLFRHKLAQLDCSRDVWGNVFVFNRTLQSDSYANHGGNSLDSNHCERGPGGTFIFSHYTVQLSLPTLSNVDGRQD